MRWILLACSALISACSLDVTIHDENAAADTALSFAEVLLFREDPAAAQNMVDEQVRQQLTQNALAQVLAAYNQSGMPLKLSVEAYETLGGKRLINIYIRGDESERSHYYKTTLRGNKDSEYRIVGFLRADEKPPTAGLYREFEERRVIAR